MNSQDAKAKMISKVVARENNLRKGKGQAEMAPVVILAWGHVLMKAPDAVFNAIADDPDKVRTYVEAEMNKSL